MARGIRIDGIQPSVMKRRAALAFANAAFHPKGGMSARKMLDMGLCGAAVIDHAAPEERDQIACAARSLGFLGKGGIAVSSRIDLRPTNQTFDLGYIRGCGYVAARRRPSGFARARLSHFRRALAALWPPSGRQAY